MYKRQNRNGVSVELHRLAAYSLDPFVDKRLQCFVKLYLDNGYAGYEKYNWSNLLLPPVQFDACYLFYHLAKHFLMEGIGLRQICDWTLYLYTYADKLDKEQLLKDIRSLGMLRLWEIFGCIAVDYLGLPQSNFPGYNPLRRTQAADLMNSVLSVGNFGHYAPSRGFRPNDYYAGKWYAFRKWIWWKVKILRLNPYWIGRVSLFSFGHSIKVALLHR